jgi:hypothetical protein
MCLFLGYFHRPARWPSGPALGASGRDIRSLPLQAPQAGPQGRACRPSGAPARDSGLESDAAEVPRRGAAWCQPAFGCPALSSAIGQGGIRQLRGSNGPVLSGMRTLDPCRCLDSPHPCHRHSGSCSSAAMRARLCSKGRGIWTSSSCSHWTLIGARRLEQAGGRLCMAIPIPVSEWAAGANPRERDVSKPWTRTR